MFTRKLTRPFQAAIAAGALSALFAAAPAQASDQSAWLQEQLSITDGGASYVAYVARWQQYRRLLQDGHPERMAPGAARH